MTILFSLLQGRGSVGAGETEVGHQKTVPAADEILAQEIQSPC